MRCHFYTEAGVLYLNFTSHVLFLQHSAGPLARSMQLRASFFDAFADIGSQQAKEFLLAKLRRAEVDPAAARLRAEVDGDGAASLKNVIDVDVDDGKRSLSEMALEDGRFRLKLRRLEAARAAQGLLKDTAEAEQAKSAAEQAKVAAEQSRVREMSQTHESFRRERALTIQANAEALRSLRVEMSPRTKRAVEDQLRTGLLGRERPDPELGRPMYCSTFLKEQLRLTDYASTERAKVFGTDVVEAMQRLFPS